MPHNIHENEDLSTYARSVTWVTQGSFELSALNDTANGLLHADQGIRISTNKAELVLTGEGKTAAGGKTEPFIFASVPKGGSILMDGNNGDPANLAFLHVGESQVQALGGSALGPTSLLISDNLFEAVVGIGITAATHSKISMNSTGITLNTGPLSRIEMKPDSITLECGPLASIEIKPDNIALKVGEINFSLSALEAKIRALESEIHLNALRIRKRAVSLENKAEMLAKSVETLKQENTQAITEIKAALHIES
jgi:hypothetical protein